MSLHARAPLRYATRWWVANVPVARLHDLAELKRFTAAARRLGLFHRLWRASKDASGVAAAISNVAVVPRGTLRFSAPVWAASAWFTRMLAEYHQRYPDVLFDIDLSGRIVSLVEEGFDLALRATTPSRLDPGLIARPLIEVPFHAVASPGYLARTGRPRTLSELNGHALLMYSGMSSDGNVVLHGRSGDETVRFLGRSCGS